MKNKFIPVLLLVVAFLGCDKSNQAPAPSAASEQFVAKSPPLTNLQWYDSLYYRRFGYCGDTLTHSYQQTNNEKIGTDEKGRDVLARLTLILFTDLKYFVAVYREVTVTEYSGTSFTYESAKEKKIEGQWWFNEDSLVLADVGIIPKTVTTEGKFMFRPLADILAKGFKGREHLLLPAMTHSAPAMELDPCGRL